MVHYTRLKEQVIARIPELEADKKGRDIILAFKEDIGPMPSDACSYRNAIILSKAADILWKEMLKHRTKFSNEKNDFGVAAIPPSLIEFVCSIV